MHRLVLTFYKNTSTPDTLDKEITAIGTSTPIAPTSTVEKLNPVLVIDYDESLLPANYCYIDLFDRYYYCTMAVDIASRLIVSCKCDPLMSAKDSIKNCPACILRNENIGINYVIDKKLPVDPNRFSIHGLPFPIDGFNQASQGTGDNYKPYLLILNG